LIKKPPIQTPFFYDTKEGIDHFTKILKDESSHKYTDKDNAELNKLNLDMKKAVLDHHSKTIKKFDNHDPKTYPSDPIQRGKLLEIGKLENDLKKNNINHNPKYMAKTQKRNYWDETMKLNKNNKGPTKLPELTPEEIKRAKQPSDWDVIWGSMNPIERGQWNAEKRKEKLEKQKEEREDPTSSLNMAKQVVDSMNISLKDNKVREEKDIAPRPRYPRDQMVFPFAKSKPKPYGLHEEFVRDKLRESELVQQIEKEIDYDEKI
jgi:hypothetical protein